MLDILQLRDKYKSYTTKELREMYVEIEREIDKRETMAIRRYLAEQDDRDTVRNTAKYLVSQRRDK